MATHEIKKIQDELKLLADNVALAITQDDGTAKDELNKLVKRASELMVQAQTGDLPKSDEKDEQAEGEQTNAKGKNNADQADENANTSNHSDKQKEAPKQAAKAHK